MLKPLPELINKLQPEENIKTCKYMHNICVYGNPFILFGLNDSLMLSFCFTITVERWKYGMQLHMLKKENDDR